MLRRIRRGAGQWLASGGYLAIAVLGAQTDDSRAWIAAALIIALLAAIAWQGSLRRQRAVADTPTSNIASAAQGYVELLGKGQAVGELLAAPLNGLPCLWYRYKVERKQDDKWVTESSGESSEVFALDDGSGRCIVDPDGAEVLPAGTDTWTRGDHRYTQSLIIQGERVYVLGRFKTTNGASLDLDVAEDVKCLLAEWKQDMRGLLRRFDLDGNGELDMQEWEMARAQAKREVLRLHQAKREEPDRHGIGETDCGRPFVISSMPPERLERRYLWWGIFHFAVALAALAAAGYLWQIPAA